MFFVLLLNYIQDQKLLQLHYHAPSEHTVNGNSFPMEMHFVHKHEDGGLTVIGVLIEEGGADNSAFTAL